MLDAWNIHCSLVCWGSTSQQALIPPTSAGIATFVAQGPPYLHFASLRNRGLLHMSLAVMAAADLLVAIADVAAGCRGVHAAGGLPRPAS